jgi:hypothetical protein
VDSPPGFDLSGPPGFAVGPFVPVVVVLPLLAALGFVPLLVELPLFSGIAASPALDAPACANAKEDESANAPANAIVLSFMVVSSWVSPII